MTPKQAMSHARALALRLRQLSSTGKPTTRTDMDPEVKQQYAEAIEVLMHEVQAYGRLVDGLGEHVYDLESMYELYKDAIEVNR